MRREILIPRSVLEPRSPVNGMETCDRLLAGVGFNPASAAIRFGHFTARKTETVTQAKVPTLGTAAAATPTVCGYVLCSEAANGDLTVIAVTANDTTLFAAVVTDYPKAYAASVQLVAGTRYAHGTLLISGSSMPLLAGMTVPAAVTFGKTERSTLASRVTTKNSGTTLSALPSLGDVFTKASDLGSSGFFPYAYIAP